MSIKGQRHPLILTKGHSDFKIKTFSQETVGSYETKVHMKTYGRRGMKIYTNELGHMAKMAAMPIYGKNKRAMRPRIAHLSKQAKGQTSFKLNHPDILKLSKYERQWLNVKGLPRPLMRNMFLCSTMQLFVKLSIKIFYNIHELFPYKSP